MDFRDKGYRFSQPAHRVPRGVVHSVSEFPLVTKDCLLILLDLLTITSQVTDLGKKNDISYYCF